MSTKRLLILAMMCAGSLTASAAGQAQEYTDPDGKYKCSLVGDWKAVGYSDAVGRPKTEFVYGDRSAGLLKITREKLNGNPLANRVREEEDNLKMYIVGFERSSIEHFDVGERDGVRFAFFSANGGRKLAASYYYIQDGDAVWVLKFTGRRGTLDTIRNVTDRMARSFLPLEK
jgi:hypothetical protein